ncbi:MAG: hypothetical protein F4Z08_05635 [Chloroflexi bacterium]|nr:hypothetical protein [Chloroflexota bacterium]
MLPFAWSHLRRLLAVLVSRRAASIAALGLAVLLGAVAGSTPGEAQRVGLGEENSWLRIQNVGIQHAEIDIEFYDKEGAAVARDFCPRDGGCGALPPGFGWSFFQQGYRPLEAGYRGSASVTVDQPFVALLARDVFKAGLFQIGGDSLRLSVGSQAQYAPIVQNTAEYVSRLSVANLSDEHAACFQILYYDEGATEPIVDPPGRTAGCSSGGWLVGPRGTLLRDEHDLPVPMGFDGSAVIVAVRTSSGVEADEQLPSLMVDTRERDGPGLATYRAFDGLELSHEIVLPLVDRNASEGRTTWTTRFRIFSSVPGNDNEVELLFTGQDDTGAEIEIEHSVQVASTLTCDQRLDGAGGCLPDDVSLPDVFFGSVRARSVHPIAIVAQRLSRDGALADYRGFTAEEAARELMLPVLNKNFGPWGDFNGWNSWFRVATFDGSEGSMHVMYFSKQFPNGLLSRLIPLDGQRTVRQWEEGRLPDGWVGSGIIIADRPVVAVANLESDVFEGDPVMLYNGVSLK